ncbi:Bax inhibitor-1/YccA family protein [Lactobacillus sp. CC-MHH1034]|uniref:Bax inhibitor-1/YccA family protein n=1 Tax=Agrilactobacillus fermenti TaxID=2586909 RepID=UPI001E570485|nr:Bax inhibitor-1/YccA family protein [Agrilactobacillus fermenti]MCD2256656.1 Bax inhibitor-1/YccA family protein [Agrilactobacillus fermenti]
MQQVPSKEVYVKDVGLNRFFTRVYSYMGLGIAISALISFLALNTFRDQYSQLLQEHPMTLWILFIAEIAMVFGFRATQRRSTAINLALFASFAAINGLVLSVTLSFYNIADITTAFVTAAALFVALAIVGFVTKRNLSRMGQMSMALLIGLILASVINLFMQSSFMQLILSYVGVLIFSMLTAYDNQYLKGVYYQSVNRGDLSADVSLNNIAVMGALNLYLDFINIFLYILQIFGFDTQNN